MKKNVVFTMLFMLGISFGVFAQTPCKGSLVVNEISNGPNGTKEFVELFVFGCSGCTTATVDVSGWIIDDNNGIFSGLTSSGLGISAGYLRLSNDSLWQNFEKGKLLVLFNQQNFDTTNANFLAAASGVDFYDNGTAIFVAVGYGSKLVERNTATPVVGGSARNGYCGFGSYDTSRTAWDAIALNNGRNPGDGIQVRCPGCVSAIGEPAFFHGFSYGNEMNHLDTPVLGGAHYEFQPGDTTATGGAINGQGRVFKFFNNFDPGVDANWVMLHDSVANPGDLNSADNFAFYDSVRLGQKTFTVCAQDPGNPIANPGVLIVNEVANGPNGAKEFVEFIVGRTNSNPGTVDISGWIIDDNNSIFSGINAPGYGISGGHLRLSNDSIFQNFNPDLLLILFNKQDFDTTHPIFGATMLTASGLEYYDDGNAIWIAVGDSSPLVQVNFSTPLVASGNTSALYCGAGSFAVRDTFAWNTIGLSNSRIGDGIQVRCEGCVGSLGEPSFFHGISYGDTTMHVNNPTLGFIDGAHVDFLPLGIDTNAQGFEIGGTGRAFQFYQGTDPGADINWQYISAAAATPGDYNNSDNLSYRNTVMAGSIVYACCDVDTSTQNPPNTGGTGGVLIMTELSNGPSGNCEYVELLVAACGDNLSTVVDIRGWILDDNSGNLSSGCGTGQGISAGHLRFDSVPTWENVPVGSIIVLYNVAANCYNFPIDTNDTNLDSVYYIAVGTNVSVMDRRTNRPSASPVNCDYCDTTAYIPTNASAWNTHVALGNDGDGMQVRCPGCFLDGSTVVEPAFYHGMAYGSGFHGLSAGSSDLGAAYSSGSGSGRKYEFYQNTAPGVDLNWRRLSADAGGTPPATAGKVFAGFRDSVILKTLEFPCCGTVSPSSLAPANFNGVKEQVEGVNNALVFPNPANEVLNVSVRSTESYEVKLVDLMGRVVFAQTYAGNQEMSTIQVNTAALSAGVYVYTITSATGAVSGKVVIE